ncbi:MAG: disulfide bond formation protein DsbD, partial [Rudanella sp.]|nr:disulfide bond formation protein DsbD [Rudanella sp.]
MKKSLTLWVLLLLPLLSQGQIIKPANWTTSVSKSKVQIGDVVTLNFEVNLKDGYHIYSSEANPKIQDGPLPTVFTFAPNKTYELIGKLKPTSKVETKFEEVWGGDTYTMHSSARFAQQVRILALAPQIKVNVNYQTCTDVGGVCIPGDEDLEIAGLTVRDGTAPTTSTATLTSSASLTKPVSTSTTAASMVAATSTEPTSENDDVAATDSLAPVKSDIADSLTALEGTQDQQADGSMWGFILTAFLSGLVALLTPCVFPIIPMTVSFFTNQKGGAWKALLYGASIIAIYVLIGTIVSRINGPAFANFVSTHWLPNVLFFAVFFVFGLSFLGLFEIVLPSSLVNKADAQSERGGVLGILFMA